ncbi:MurR/RpiR family transcriptional regulator [Roseospira navarrensis]|uniref:SIS domain-containing protein n=1 Tax=Roseospira navarrensis TaxID=140058 RepID=A0A7X1ZGP6_9PROT|nr:MurR/RpiR family transcriptional regulator [Roseospira navarrensis]MQX37112.1 SIS domain-containing protein [Roseospira navarrensis]
MTDPVRPPLLLDAISARYADLSESLRAAADYVAAHRVEVATRSLRAVAGASGVSPASYSRLARALGFEGYEALRDQARAEIESRLDSFPDKARRLRDDPDRPLLPRQVKACTANIEALLADIDPAELEAAADCLATARRVVVVGALGSAGVAHYLSYMAGWFSDRWCLAGQDGATMAGALAGLGPQDAVIVISKAPYARRAVKAVEAAARAGARLVVLTDSHAFPGLARADFRFIHRIDSPQFFSSYAATLVLIETLTGMLVARAGPAGEARIRTVAEQNRLLDEFAGDECPAFPPS